MSHEELFDTLVPVYAVGALDGDDLVRFEAHLRDGCEVCERAIRESSETFSDIGRAATPMIPPAHVRDALMQRVATSPRPRRFRWQRWAIGTAAAVFAGVAFTAGVMTARYQAQLGGIQRQAAAIRDQLRREQLTLRDEVAGARAVTELLRDPATRVVVLNGLPAAPGATGRVVWHEKAGGRLYVTGLPTPPPGKTYELWTISGATPKPAGTFDVDSRGGAVRAVAPAEDGPVKVFAITLEPEGGVPAPTGPMVLASR